MNATDGKIFDRLLSHGGTKGSVCYNDFNDWKHEFFIISRNWDIPADRAIAGGDAAGCAAYAFWAGLQAGLQSLFIDLPADRAAAFCVSEASGNRPRDIKSTITKAEHGRHIGSLWILNGEKHYISGAAEADLFIVAVSEGKDSSGKNILKMAMMDSSSPGISIAPMNNLNILPEVSHGIVRFDNVEITGDRILPGDAYTDYIKPFRTVEDLFVVSAILACLYRVSRNYNWPRSFSGKIVSLLVCARTLCVSDPREAWVHIALGSLFEDIINFFKELEPCWKMTDENVRSGWERDIAIMNIASEARMKRLEKAWGSY